MGKAGVNAEVGCSDAWAREMQRFSNSSFEQEQVDLAKGRKGHLRGEFHHLPMQDRKT